MRMERKLRARSWFWNLVKEVRDLQKQFAQEHRATYAERDRLYALQDTLDEYLAKVAPKLLSLGVIGRESEDSMHLPLGSKTKDAPISVYIARHGYEAARPMYFSVLVLLMRQAQKHQLATKNIYGIVSDRQDAVDKYLAKGELFDQLEMMPKRNHKNQQ